MRITTTLVFLGLLVVSEANAQSAIAPPGAEQIIHPSQSAATATATERSIRELNLPAGTPIDVEVAYTVNSLDIKPSERISFRVLVPILIEGVVVIEKGALVTARITQAKRGGHWGKGGKLAWSMEDVIAVDNSRVLLAPETSSHLEKLWSLENKHANKGINKGKVSGTSHTGEVAVMTVVSGVIFPPLGLLNGFKRGENAVLREGRRFIVTVGKDATVRVAAATAAHQ
jgi:hypothetical protein